MTRPLILFTAILFTLWSCTPTSENIQLEELQEHISYLASEELAGRYPGTAGDLLAAEYIAEELRANGLIPLADNGLQAFEVNTSVRAGEDNRLSEGEIEFELDVDFRPMSFSANAGLEAPLVFAGYGIKAKTSDISWDSYATIDVAGKWVLLLRGDPMDDLRSSPLEDFGADRDKCMLAKDLGAKGVILVSGVAYTAEDELDPLIKNQSAVDIPVFQMSRQAVNKLLGETPIAEREQFIRKNQIPRSEELTISLNGNAVLVQEYTSTYNVAFRLKATQAIDSNVLIYGGHYDHLGMGGSNTGSRARDTMAVHYGADDNASGVAAMLEIAEKMAAHKESLKRDVIFLAFGAEEMGLLGSKHLVENPLFSLPHSLAMINLDMIGRLKDNYTLQVGGTGTALEFDSLLKALSDTGLLKLQTSPEGYGPSDHSSFYGKGIPVLFLSTGAHLDYHTPMDKPELVNYYGLKRVSEFAAELGFQLMNQTNRLQYQESGPPPSSSHNARSKGVTFGLMPDITGSVEKGMKADFITPGKPAAAAGMEKGDVIVSIDGKEVNNINDYMYRLSRLKKGQSVIVEVLRAGEKQVLLLQL